MEETARTGELRRKLEKDPASRLFAQLAEELRKDGKLDEAISVARSGLEKIPNYPSARLTLARALLDSGRPQEALPELEKIVKASPDNIMASRLLGEALESVGHLDLAMKQFEKTLVFAPGDKAVTDRITQLKAKRAAPPPPTVPPVPLAPPTVPPAAHLPRPAGGTTLPSVFGAAPVVAAPVVAAPVPSVFEDPAPTLPPTPAAPPAPAPAPAVVALDRDLASGTFSPGSLNAADLQKHFEETAAAEAAPQFAAAPVEPEDTVGFGQLQATHPELPALPAVEMPVEDADLASQTLPLNSVTLADLYLQQGLKAEASAVLSQVMKEEPENAQAKSRFAAVSSEIAARAAMVPPTPTSAPPPPPTPTLAPTPAPTPTPPPALAAPPAPAPTPARAAAPVSYRSARAKVRDRTIASLRIFASAAEREALNQRATERGVI